MVYSRKRKALYEVIGKGRLRPSSTGKSERSHQEKDKEEKSDTSMGETAVPEGATLSWRKPKLIQFNAGRVEILLPYQLAIALILGLILLVLIAFRLGQKSIQVNPSTRSPRSAEQNPASSERLSPTAARAAPAEQKGNNRIVIQTHQSKTQLVPLEQYFDRLGIETEIKQVGKWFYLVSKDRYNNPEIEGSEGYLVKQRIIKLGANYTAPAGYEPFGAKSFASAYSMRFDD